MQALHDAAGGIEVTALLTALTALKRGESSARLPVEWTGLAGKVADAFNEVAELNERLTRELARLSRVVGKEGTAPEAKIPGYRVAGKTGTADRYDARVGGYSGKTASFIGFAPADDPQIVVAVTLQRPIKGYFGGAVAGPVFRDVMTYALQELRIPPTGTKAPVVRVKADKPAADDPTVVRDKRSASSRSGG